MCRSVSYAINYELRRKTKLRSLLLWMWQWHRSLRLPFLWRFRCLLSRRRGSNHQAELCDNHWKLHRQPLHRRKHRTPNRTHKYRWSPSFSAARSTSFRTILHCPRTPSMNRFLDWFLYILSPNCPQFWDLCEVQSPMNLAHSAVATVVASLLADLRIRPCQTLALNPHRLHWCRAMDAFLCYRWMKCDHLGASPTNKIPHRSQSSWAIYWWDRWSIDCKENLYFFVHFSDFRVFWVLWILWIFCFFFLIFSNFSNFPIILVISHSILMEKNCLPRDHCAAHYNDLYSTNHLWSHFAHRLREMHSLDAQSVTK